MKMIQPADIIHVREGDRLFVVTEAGRRPRVVTVTAVDHDRCEVRAGSETFGPDQIAGWALGPL